MLVGLLVLALFAGSLVFAFNATMGVPWHDHTYAKVAFNDVGSLRTGDDVRINSVRVGQVSKIELSGMQPVVTLKLDGDRPVYRDATAAAASVGARSALGQKFIDFSAGTPPAGRLGPEEVVPANQTVPSQELSDVLDVLDPPTREALGKTLREAGGGMAGHSGDLHDAVGTAPGMLKDLGTVSRTAGAQTDLAGMLRSADTLASRFSGREQQLSSLISQSDSTLRAVGVDGGEPLNATLRQGPDALRDAREALELVQEPLQHTESAMTQLRPGAEALAAATPDIRGVLREGVAPLNKVPGVMHQAEPAVADLTGVFADARPLAPKVGRALDLANEPLQQLAPYSPEIGLWFTYARDALKDGDAAGHWLRIDILANTESVSGTVPVPDPITARNPYPAPGQAQQEKRSGIGGGR
ncbi:MlaD family protein [Saccharopolyspora sp. NPDC049426]|uniref:MlaD family protein n=1 Tax=Saccharopolyspora sp. NPDC049426 TaxID=3155652 RepID=UPI0034443B8D